MYLLYFDLLLWIVKQNVRVSRFEDFARYRWIEMKELLDNKISRYGLQIFCFLSTRIDTSFPT